MFSRINAVYSSLDSGDCAHCRKSRAKCLHLQTIPSQELFIRKILRSSLHPMMVLSFASAQKACWKNMVLANFSLEWSNSAFSQNANTALCSSSQNITASVIVKQISPTIESVDRFLSTILDDVKFRKKSSIFPRKMRENFQDWNDRKGFAQGVTFLICTIFIKVYTY